MPGNTTSVLITEGFSPASPWLLENLDKNLKDYAVAVLARSQSNQSIALTTQNNVLIEQTNQLEKMQDYTEEIAAGTETALVLDSSGKILIDDPNIVSDLVSRQVTSLSSTETNRLIDFATQLDKSVPKVNLGGQSYLSITVQVGQPPSARSMSAPLRVWSSDPSGISTSDIQPFVCYAFKAQDGTIKYRICDQNKQNFSISGVTSLDLPDAKFVFDAFRVNTGSVENPTYKVFVPKDTATDFPASETTETLYRNVFTGEIRLVGPSKPNIPFVSSEGFVVPATQDEVNFWFGQAAAQRLIDTNKQFLADNVKMPIEPDTFQWKYKDFAAGGFSSYPPTKGLPSDVKLAVGSLVEDVGSGKIYLISGRVAGVNKFVEVEKVGDPFVLKLVPDDLVKIRGQYTEQIIQATQRTTQQQLFLNSLIQKFNLFFDAATNILKMLSDKDDRLANAI